MQPDLQQPEKPAGRNQQGESIALGPRETKRGKQSVPRALPRAPLCWESSAPGGDLGQERCWMRLPLFLTLPTPPPALQQHCYAMFGRGGAISDPEAAELCSGSSQH